MTDPQTTTQGDAAAEVAKWKDVAARAQADLQNAKERLKREREDIGAFANEQFMRSLLPTLDAFQRAFSHLPKDLEGHEWVKGVTAIEQDLLRRVQDAGLTKMDAAGKPLDPERHEVLMTAPGPADTVIEVLEEGYELSGRVLRPAKVKAGDGTQAQ